MKSLILNFFELVLKIRFELILDTFHKSPRITKVPSKKGLKFFSGHGNICAFIKSMKMLILSLAENNTFAGEKSSK